MQFVAIGVQSGVGVLLFGRMFHHCVTATECETAAAVATDSIVFSLGTVDDATENKSVWSLMFHEYIHQQLKAFIIRLRIIVFFVLLN
jgi:hypothetical protein